MRGMQPGSKASIIAARRGNLNCLKVLEEHGHSLMDDVLDHAVLYGHVDVIKYLIDLRMIPSITAFGHAARSGDIDLFKLLLSPGKSEYSNN